MNWKPKEPKIAYAVLNAPEAEVVFSELAHKKISFLVNKCNGEVGWLGDCYYNPDDKVYTIKDIVVPKQVVSTGETDISAGAVADTAVQLLTQGRDEFVDNLRFWGHSHVNMGTSPSSQDDSQMAIFKDNGCEWFLRGIFNKQGEVNLTLYLWKQDLIIYNVPFESTLPQVADPILIALDAETEANVSEKKYIVVGSSPSASGNVSQSSSDTRPNPNTTEDNKADFFTRGRWNGSTSRGRIGTRFPVFMVKPINSLSDFSIASDPRDTNVYDPVSGNAIIGYLLDDKENLIKKQDKTIVFTSDQIDAYYDKHPQRNVFIPAHLRAHR